VDLEWTKSTYCADKACVEVALINVETVGLRDGKDVRQPHLEFSRAEWMSFLDDVADRSLEVR
jgi:Domain of unknown function (DUF397)